MNEHRKSPRPLCLTVKDTHNSECYQQDEKRAVFDTLTRNDTLTLNVNMIKSAFRNLTTEELELFLSAKN